MVAEGTRCWRESQPMLASDQGCTFGLARIGMSPIPGELLSCPFAAISAWESHSSFGCVSLNERRNHEYQAARTIACLRLHACPCISGADQTHRDASGRHDVKLLSIRGEATPRTPV